MTLTITELEPLGAVIDADIDTLLTADGVPERLMEALEENGVLIFPEVGMTDAQQVEFTRRLGEVRLIGMGTLEEQPEIYQVGFSDELTNELYVKGAFFWHIDGTTDPIPSKASLLSCKSTVAKGPGGDTMFVDTYAAYDALSDDEKQRIDGLIARHTVEKAFRMFLPDPPPELLQRLRAAPKYTHPVVWNHRDTGRKSLVLGATATDIEGMDPAEGEALLDDLLERATTEDRVLRHTWKVGDLVMWDNRGTLHRADAYDTDSGRMMHRCTIEGDEPIQ